MSETTEVWGVIDLDVGSEAERTLGDLTVRVRRTPEEVWVHGAYGAPEPPANEDWTRWAVQRGDATALRPALPDRLVVVSPEQPFILPPHGWAHVFVRIPLFVALASVAEDGHETVLSRYPAMVLSDTWWGSFTDGELAYWLTTKARRVVSPEIFGYHLAVCPLRLANESGDALPVEHFAVRVAHLTLFGRGSALWTDEVLVRYEGAEEGSEIRYTGRVPDVAGDVAPIAGPREAPPRGLTALTFGRFRALSGWS